MKQVWIVGLTLLMCAGPLQAQQLGPDRVDGKDAKQWLAEFKAKPSEDAARALGVMRLRSEPAIPALIAALKHPAVREEAATALGLIGACLSDLNYVGPECHPSRIGGAIPALIKLLKAKDAGVRLSAALAICRIGGKGSARAAGALGKLIRKDPSVAGWLGLLGPFGKKAVGRMVAVIKGKDEGRARGAVRALGEIGPGATKAVPALIKRLKALGENGATSDTAQALGRIGDARAVPALVAALQASPKPGRQAIVALGQIGPAASAAVPVLMTRLKDKRSSPLASRALALIGDAALKPLVRLLGDATATGFARERAAVALQDQFGAAYTPGARDPFVPQLIAALEGAKPGRETRGMRYQLVFALRDVGRAAAPSVAALLVQFADARDDKLQIAVCEALVALGPAAAPAAQPLLEFLRKTRKPFLRRAIVRALGSMGPAAKAAEADLAKLSADGSDPLLALEAKLARLRVSALPTWAAEVIAALKACKGLDEFRLAVRGLKPLGAQGSPALPFLIDVLEGKGPIHAGLDDSKWVGGLNHDRFVLVRLAAHAIGSLGAGAKPALKVLHRKLLTSGHVDLTLSFLGALESIHDPSSKGPIQEIAEGVRSWDARRAASQVLARWDSK